MKKSEMEWHFNRLREASSSIAIMIRERPINLLLFDRCVEAFEDIAPALQFWAKERPDNEPMSIVPYQVIDSFGPILFAHDAIEAMCHHINSTRYLKRAELPFARMVETIHAREREAVALWTWIEQNAGREHTCMWQEVGVDQGSGMNTLDRWVDLGVVVRIPTGCTYKLAFASDLSALVIAMCPNCGVTGKARREILYRKQACQKCRVEVFYHCIRMVDA